MNAGWKVANNVKVFFPSEGFLEIAKDGSTIGSKNHTGWLDLGTLEPSSQFIVTMWTMIPRERIRVISDAGAANVREWYVSRDENRWVIGFGPFEIVFFGFIALFVSWIVFGLVVNAIESQSKTTTGSQKQTHASASKTASKPQ